MRMMQSELDTKGKIIIKTIDLIAKMGFKEVTTKQIAEAAGVSEITVFRHFQSKKKLLLEALKVCAKPSAYLEELFTSGKLGRDLENDIHLIAQAYLCLLLDNLKIIKIIFHEANNIPEINATVDKQRFMNRTRLTEYFDTMQRCDKVVNGDSGIQASSLLWLCFGFFISRVILRNEPPSQADNESFENSLRLFARGIAR